MRRVNPMLQLNVVKRKAPLPVGTLVWDEAVQRYGLVTKHKKLTHKIVISYGSLPGTETEFSYDSVLDLITRQQLVRFLPGSLMNVVVPVVPFLWKQYGPPKGKMAQEADLRQTIQSWQHRVADKMPHHYLITSGNADDRTATLLWHGNSGVSVGEILECATLLNGAL